MSAPSAARLYRWESLPRKELAPNVGVRMIECDSMTVTEVFFEAGAPYALHSHAAEQVCYVLKGLLRVWAGVGEVEPLDVAAGDIVQFASNVPHRIEAIEETLMVQVSTPRRQDIADRMRAAES